MADTAEPQINHIEMGYGARGVRAYEEQAQKKALQHVLGCEDPYCKRIARAILKDINALAPYLVGGGYKIVPE